MPQEGPNKGDFTAVGIYGQYVYINPNRGIVIAKNAADREFAYPQDGYGHSMNVNVDMFRSLADYYDRQTYGTFERAPNVIQPDGSSIPFEELPEARQKAFKGQ